MPECAVHHVYRAMNIISTDSYSHLVERFADIGEDSLKMFYKLLFLEILDFSFHKSRKPDHDVIVLFTCPLGQFPTWVGEELS